MMRAISSLLLAVVCLSAQRFDQALEAIGRNDGQAGEQALDALPKASPQDREVALARGVYLFQLGKFSDARRALEPLRADPRAETFVLLSRAATGECPAVASALRGSFE